MLFETLSTDFRKARGVNATDTSFPSKIPTTTEPVTPATETATSASVIELATGGALAQNSVLLVPYATGGDGDTFSIRVIGWRKLPRMTEASHLWVPVKLLELACTLSTVVGVAGAPIVAAERFADTLALVGTSGNDDVSMDLVSPADNTIAHCLLDVKGFQKLEVTFDSTAAGTTDMNCLLGLL